MAHLLFKAATKMVGITLRVAGAAHVLGPAAELAFNAGALGAGYWYWRRRYIAEKEVSVDHLIPDVPEVGDYGLGVCEVDTPNERELTPEEAASLELELEIVATFNPFYPELSSGLRHRRVLRYWVDRVYEMFALIKDTPADRAVLRRRVCAWMREKNYRLCDASAMADTVVGLAVAGTRLRELSAAIPAKTRERSLLDRFFFYRKSTTVG